MLLIKFGKKAHLEQLRNGIVHFSPIELFQKDSTSFRGDKMEGREYIDLSKPLVVNGLDISKYLSEAILSAELSCQIFSFSASLLSFKNCHLTSNGNYTPNNDFIAEMRQFGDYFLVIDSSTFINALAEKLNVSECGFEYHSITYIDKHDHDSVQNYYINQPVDQKQTAHFFIKDKANSYWLQYEWRYIMLDYKHRYTPDIRGGINLQTGFSTDAPIFNVDTLCTLQCSEDLLK